jgi:uncharacterized protein involved in type VI secretion and phage assembly
LDDVLTQVAREAQRRYYGKYRGFVVDNADPQKLGRLQVTVPSVLAGTTSDWALPVLSFAGAADIGQLALPEIGAAVWVEFEEGDLSRPLWVGAFWPPPTQPAGGSQPTLGDPAVRGLHTSAGHVLVFDDTSGSEAFHLEHPAGATVTIDANGTITLTDGSGGQIALDADATKVTIEDANGNSAVLDSQGVAVADANGNQMQMAASGVTVTGQQVKIDATQVQIGSAASEPVIKGQSFLSAYLSHTHPTAMGPSGPPIPTTEMTSLSTAVMTG